MTFVIGAMAVLGVLGIVFDHAAFWVLAIVVGLLGLVFEDRL